MNGEVKSRCKMREDVHRLVVQVAKQRRVALAETHAFALCSPISVLDVRSAQEVVRLPLLAELFELAQSVHWRLPWR